MILFFIYLCCAACQDIYRRELDFRFLICFGLLGVLNCLTQEKSLILTGVSVAEGVGILILSRLTRGGVGEGDGWFFVISGLLLGPEENMALLLSGLALCGVFCLVLVTVAFVRGKGVRKLRIPFLPFLLPAGIWMAFR